MAHSGEEAAKFTDTSPRARARYLERLRAMSPLDRLRRAMELSKQMRDLTMSDVRRQNPGATERDVKVAFVRRVYGDRLADRLSKSLK